MIPFLFINTIKKEEKKILNLSIEIENIKKNKGFVMIAIHNQGNFLKSRLVEKKITTDQNIAIFSTDLEEGNYAVAIYQDENGNQKLDTNLFGVPIEAYGFSNQARPKFRAPTFEEAKINLRGQSKTIKIRLDNW